MRHGLLKQLGEIGRGILPNAVWDGLQWLFWLAVPMVSSVVVGAAKETMLATWIVSGFTFGIVGITVHLIRRRGRPKRGILAPRHLGRSRLNGSVSGPAISLLRKNLRQQLEGYSSAEQDLLFKARADRDHAIHRVPARDNKPEYLLVNSESLDGDNDRSWYLGALESLQRRGEHIIRGDEHGFYQLGDEGITLADELHRQEEDRQSAEQRRQAAIQRAASPVKAPRPYRPPHRSAVFRGCMAAAMSLAIVAIFYEDRSVEQRRLDLNAYASKADLADSIPCSGSLLQMRSSGNVLIRCAVAESIPPPEPDSIYIDPNGIYLYVQDSACAGGTIDVEIGPEMFVGAIQGAAQRRYFEPRLLYAIGPDSDSNQYYVPASPIVQRQFEYGLQIAGLAKTSGAIVRYNIPRAVAGVSSMCLVAVIALYYWRVSRGAGCISYIPSEVARSTTINAPSVSEMAAEIRQASPVAMHASSEPDLCDHFEAHQTKLAAAAVAQLVIRREHAPHHPSSETALVGQVESAPSDNCGTPTRRIRFYSHDLRHLARAAATRRWKDAQLCYVAYGSALAEPASPRIQALFRHMFDIDAPVDDHFNRRENFLSTISANAQMLLRRMLRNESEGEIEFSRERMIGPRTLGGAQQNNEADAPWHRAALELLKAEAIYPYKSTAYRLRPWVVDCFKSASL